MEPSLASLHAAAARGQPVTTADTRLMEVRGELSELFPEGGVRRGSTVGIGPGGTSLALALLSGVTAAGTWAVAVGQPALGLVAAAEMGARLDRLALIPYPGEQWATVTAALVDGFDLVSLRPPARVKAADARRLAARVRERGAVLALQGEGWPESPDIRLRVVRSAWSGLGAGHGRLTARHIEVVSDGRRAAGRERRCSFWLPGPAPLTVLAG